MAALIIGVVSVRLLYAPIDFSFARPLVLEQTAALLPGWRLDYTSSEVGWDWSELRPWVRLEETTLLDRRDRLVAYIPEARLGLSRALLSGEVALASVDVRDVKVTVKDLAAFSDADENGMLRSLFGETGLPTTEIFKPLTEAFSRFSRRLINIAPDLSVIGLDNAVFVVERGSDLEDAYFSVPRMRLTQEGAHLALDVISDVTLGNAPVRIKAEGIAAPMIGSLDIAASISDIYPSHLQADFALPEFLAYVNIPIAFDIDAKLTSEQGLEFAEIKGDIGEGSLNDPLKFPKAAPIRYGTLEASYDPAKRIINLDRLEASTGDRTAIASGLIYWEEDKDRPGIRFEASVPQASIDEILRYWPARYYPDGRMRGGRAWVQTNMIGGYGRNAVFRVDIDPDGKGAFARESKLLLTFDFADVSTRYLKDMAPVRNASGRGTLTRHTLDIHVDAATVDGMPISDSRVLLTDIDKKDKKMGYFTVGVEGPVRKILGVIDADPIYIGRKIQVDLDRLGGEAKLVADISLPLLKKLPQDAVKYDVRGTVSDAFARDILDGEGLRDGELTIELDTDVMVITGTGELNGVPLRMDWKEDFKLGRDDETAETTRLLASGTVDEQGLQALKVDVGQFLSGSLSGEAVFTGRALKFTKGEFKGVSSGARLNVDQIAWKSKPDVPFEFSGAVAFSPDGPVLDPFRVWGEEVDATITMAWDRAVAGKMQGVFDIERLGAHRGQQIDLALDGKGNAEITVLADRFDARQLLARASTGDVEAAHIPTETAPPLTGAESTGPATTKLSLMARELLLLNGEVLYEAGLTTDFVDEEPQETRLNGLITDQKLATTVSITPVADGHNDLSFSSMNAGAVLRGLGLFAHLDGAEITMTGKTSGWGPSLYLAGETKTKSRISVLSTKELDGQVTEGIVTGLDDYLKGGPVLLTDADIAFSYDQGLLDFDRVKANGNSLGMTLEGQIHTGERKVNMNGVIIPAYGLNALFGKIPLIGTILTGGSGKGIFGFAYRVKGSLDNPSFNVNPLSGLAPGFLRLLFEGGKGKVADVETPSPDKQGDGKDAEGNEKDNGSGKDGAG